jgi:hypothetical protein
MREDKTSKEKRGEERRWEEKTRKKQQTLMASRR